MKGRRRRLPKRSLSGPTLWPALRQEREYKPGKDKLLLIFEYYSEMRLRRGQKKLISKMANADPSMRENLVINEKDLNLLRFAASPEEAVRELQTGLQEKKIGSGPYG
jgi:hypothetical protein